MGEPHPIEPGARRKLGELLVQRGLLTEEQLGAALAEQQASGLPLGAILVRDGLVASHKVAILLAEQSGGPLKTEFGYAVGAAPSEAPVADVLSLRPPVPVEPPVSEPALDGLRLALPESPPEPAPVLEPVQALHEVVAVLPVAAPAPQTREPGVELLEARLEAEVSARTALEAKLADVEAGTEAALAGRAELEAKLAQLAARTEEALAGRAALEATLAQLVTHAEAVAAERSALAEKIGQVEARAEEALAGRAAVEAKLAELEARAGSAVGEQPALEQELVTLRARTEEAEANVCLTQSRQAALHDRLTALELRGEELDAVRTSEARAITGRPYTSERHILLAPVGERYELVERSGPAPEAGSRVELFDDRSFVVVRVGPAPIPGALEACAYLEPIPTRLPPPDADTELT